MGRQCSLAACLNFPLPTLGLLHPQCLTISSLDLCFNSIITRRSTGGLHTASEPLRLRTASEQRFRKQACTIACTETPEEEWIGRNRRSVIVFGWLQDTRARLPLQNFAPSAESGDGHLTSSLEELPGDGFCGVVSLLRPMAAAGSVLNTNISRNQLHRGHRFHRISRFAAPH